MEPALHAEQEFVTEDLSVVGPLPAGSQTREPGDRIGGRYVVAGELGRGGMAVVYRVLDESTGRELALKQLSVLPSQADFAQHAPAFEREFHALVQLAHPRIIEVYDFGSDDYGRYYTMELLAGGDLRQHVPIPWREACRLFYGVCSSLALLHSRKLIHRDISPRNIHRSRDGSAKLIDFGALVPIGSSAAVLGTPPFVPPEVLHGSALDGRTDLFSLGATLYFVLSGRLAYAAQSFARLGEAWKLRPVALSKLVSDLPPGLDALVLSLVSLDPAQRPRTAYEVMQQLAALADLAHDESADVSQAYLSTPTLVGRDGVVAALRSQIDEAREVRGGSTLLRAAAGLGRSRLLDACALDAKLAGAVVLRVNAGGAYDAPLAVGQALAEQVLEAVPQVADDALEPELRETLASPSAEEAALGPQRARLRDLTGRTGDRARIQSALTRWLLRITKSQPFIVLVDDVERVDDASLSLLAALTLGAPRRRLRLILTCDSAGAVRSGPLAVIERESQRIELEPLDRSQTQTLLESLFGDVPHLSLLSERVFESARGNPRETLELVELLVKRRTLHYEGGGWTLPAQLTLSDLPTTAAEACQRRVAELSPLALRLAQLFALASHPSLSRADLARAAADVAGSELDAAISELLAARILCGEGEGFKLSRRDCYDALAASLNPVTRSERHRSLAQVYEDDSSYIVERLRHLLSCDREADGLELLTQLLSTTTSESHGLLTLTRLGADEVAAILNDALSTAERTGASTRQIGLIGRGLFALSVVTEEKHYVRTAPALLRQLRHDSGLDIYQELGEGIPAPQRLQTALMRAAQRYASTPAEGRVFDPQGAIRMLVYYVALSIAHASRTQDCVLVHSLPGLLEPFAGLSTLVHAVWQNAIATCETIADNLPEQAHARWLRVLDALANVSAQEATYVNAVRSAIHYGLGLIEARLGFADATKWADRLDGQPSQRVSAMSLRRISHLHRGDAAGAERRRKEAELLGLHTNVRSMFTSTLGAELLAYAMACDLNGLREVVQAIQQLAVRFPGWQGYRLLADGYFEQTCGRLEAARREFESGLALSEPAAEDRTRCTGAWPRLEAAYIELLVQMGLEHEAHARGLRALEACTRVGIGLSAFPIHRALAMAEAKRGDYAAACERLQGVVNELERYQIRGLELGATYEARTRVAIWSVDVPAIETYGRLTAEAYRYGQGSALGARYERLMDEARRGGIMVVPEVADLPVSSEHTSGTLFTHSRSRTADS